MANQFEFIRGGRKLWISMQDVTAKRLSTAFQVDEDSLYLKQEWGDSAVFPDDGKFNLLPYTVGTSFEVMGVEKSKQNPPSSALSYTSASTSSQSGANNYSNNQQTSRLFAAFKKSTDKTSFACKIVLADKTGKGFTEKNQMYLTLREDSANVPFVLDKAKEKFGKELILVSGNGLPIEDEEGTRGSKFWKCPSRKIYAISRHSESKHKRKNKVFTESSDSELDQSIIPKKRRSFTQDFQVLADEVKSLQSQVLKVSKGMEEVVNTIKDLTAISQSMAIPLSIVKILRDTFRCTICLKQPMRPPIVAAKCCNILLGCAGCVNTWYGGADGLDKCCPHCREPRGYASTSQFKGLDEFLQGIQAIFSTSDDQHDSSQDQDE